MNRYDAWELRNMTPTMALCHIADCVQDVRLAYDLFGLVPLLQDEENQ